MDLRWRDIGVCIALTVLVAGCSSVSGPTIHPDDVVLTASVKPSDVTACFPDVRWILEVELDHTGAGPLHVGERRYMSEVNAFDGERPLAPDENGMGCAEDAGDFAGAHLAIGNDGRTYTLAVRAAHDSGALPLTYPETRSAATGFTYFGTDFPVKVRYYLKGAQPPPRQLAVVYAHYEKRWGRDYSWTKTVHAKRGGQTWGSP